MKVEFFKHALTESDRCAASQTLENIFLSAGPKVAEFEQAFAKYLNVKNVVAVNSCTSALHLSLLALDVGPCDEVITTPLTFAATINAILYTGAKPVLVDVDRLTGNIDIGLLRKALTDKTAAILPVHLYGTMVNIEEIKTLLYEENREYVNIVEDAAHCIEGQSHGHRPGTDSDSACFSFYATKNMTCGEGGAIATNDDELAEDVRQLRCHGMTKNAADRHNGKFSHWDINMLGYKANMTDFQAALLLAQLPRLDMQLARRREIFQRYVKGLPESVDIPGICSPFFGRNAHHLFTIWVEPDRRDEIIVKLNAAGIGTTVNYRPVHQLSYYKKMFTGCNLPNAEQIGASTISLPFYPSLRDDEVDYVIKTLRELYDKSIGYVSF